jgi:hypothetical protein
MNKPTVFILHHSASPSTTKVGDIDRWHTARWPNFISRRGYFVGYHYVIEADGTTIQTRDHDEEGAHCIGMNRSSIGICFTGNFNLTEPTIQQLTAWYKLHAKLVKEFGDLPIRPHRAYARTDCFGTKLADDYFAVSNNKLTIIELLKQVKSILQSLLTNKTMK